MFCKKKFLEGETKEQVPCKRPSFRSGRKGRVELPFHGPQPYVITVRPQSPLYIELIIKFVLKGYL
jgi:hypothetical protein